MLFRFCIAEYLTSYKTCSVCPPGLAKCRQQSFHIAASLGDVKQCCSLLSLAHIPSEAFTIVTSGTKRLKVCGRYSDLALGGPLTFPQETAIKPWIKSTPNTPPICFFCFVLFSVCSLLSLWLTEGWDCNKLEVSQAASATHN